MAESTTSPEIDGTAYFERRGDIYHPRSIARGGWGALISGHVVGGLLGWAVEQLVDDSDFLPARLTVDLPRPCAIEPIEVHTRDIRSGKRLRLVEAVIRQDDKVVAQASGLFLRRGEQPTGTIWSPRSKCRRSQRMRSRMPTRCSSAPMAGAWRSRIRMRTGRARGSEIHVAEVDSAAYRRRAADAFYSRGDGRRCDCLPGQLELGRLEVHQRRLHAHAESATEGTPDRAGVPEPFHPGRNRDRVGDTLR